MLNLNFLDSIIEDRLDDDLFSIVKNFNELLFQNILNYSKGVYCSFFFISNNSIMLLADSRKYTALGDENEKQVIALDNISFLSYLTSFETRITLDKLDDYPELYNVINTRFSLGDIDNYTIFIYKVWNSNFFAFHILSDKNLLQKVNFQNFQNFQNHLLLELFVKIAKVKSKSKNKIKYIGSLKYIEDFLRDINSSINNLTANVILVCGKNGLMQEKVSKYISKYLFKSSKVIDIDLNSCDHSILLAIINEMGKTSKHKIKVFSHIKKTIIIYNFENSTVYYRKKLIKAIESIYSFSKESSGEKTECNIIFCSNYNNCGDYNSLYSSEFKENFFTKIILLEDLDSRKNEIKDISERFIYNLNLKNKNNLKLGNKFVEKLIKMSFPCNIDELLYVLKYCYYLSLGSFLDEKYILQGKKSYLKFISIKYSKNNINADIKYQKRKMEIEMYLKAYFICSGNHAAMAKFLNISRGSLQYKWKILFLELLENE